MLHKVLIIDDNHSFIDSLSVILKEYSFQYDSAFRFQEAAAKIEKNGNLLNRAVVQQLFDFDESLKVWEAQLEKNAKREGEGGAVEAFGEPPEVPTVNGNFLNEQGYSLVIVEQDTETSLKGIEFIKSLCRNSDSWHESDFLILTSRADLYEAEAKANGIAMLEKPIKASALRQLTEQRIKNLETTIERSQFLFDNLDNQRENLKNTILAQANTRAAAAEEPEEKPEKSSGRKNLFSKLKGKKSEDSEKPPAKPRKSTKTRAASAKKAKKKAPAKKAAAKKPAAKKAVAKKASAKKTAARKTTAKKKTVKKTKTPAKARKVAKKKVTKKKTVKKKVTRRK